MPALNSHDLHAKARPIKLLGLDVDGVLTDGNLYYSNSGEEMKTFSTLDGQGIKLLQSTGVKVALITARSSRLLAARADNLGIEFVVQDCPDKCRALTELVGKLGFTMAETAYVGDDLPDLACIRRAGLGLTVPNAPEVIKEHALYVTAAHGGHGAVREVCDMIMKAQNTFDKAVAAFL